MSGAGWSHAPPAFVRSGRERLKDWRNSLDKVRVTADHHAVAFRDTPDSSAGAAVHKVNFLGGQSSAASNRILIVGISAVDNRVTRH